MNDLVERLREAASLPFREKYRGRFTQAANEIERLRKMVEDMQEIKLIAADPNYSAEAVGMAFRARLMP